MFQIVDSKYKIDKKQLEKVAKATFSWLKKDFEVNLAIISEKEITDLNKQYRNKNQSTDVLSFKMEADIPGGDIAIAYEVAERQAQSLNLSVGDEIAFLLVHGMLHLAGYGHDKTPEQKVMEAAENDILSKLDILIER